MKKLLVSFIFLIRGISVSIMAQVDVSSGGPVTSYPTLSAAFAAINAGTHTGAITIALTGNTTEPASPVALIASGQGSANYTSISIYPTTQVTISGAPGANNGVINFNGADYVTINGDAGDGGDIHDLTIINTNASTVTNQAVIRLIGNTTGGLGVTHFVVKNCNLIGNMDATAASPTTTTFGFYAGSPTGVTTGGGYNYDTLLIENNVIQKAFYGVFISSATTSNICDSIVIKDNIIGSSVPADRVIYRGITLNNTTKSYIINNEIFDLIVSTSLNNAAIELTGSVSTNHVIANNKIRNVHSLSTLGYGAYGINITNGGNYLIVNNDIAGIKTINYSSTSTTFNAFGIRISGGTGFGIYYNSINLYDNYTNTNYTVAASACLVITATSITGLDIKNNIFNNIMTSNAITQRFVAVWFPSSYNFANAVLNNNAYMVLSDANHFVGMGGTTTYTTLANWQVYSQTNNPTNDQNSIPVSNIPAPFTSNTDLTIPSSTVTLIESGGIPIALLGSPNVDRLGNIRPASLGGDDMAPDMGCYEFGGYQYSPNDVGISAIISPSTTGCYSATHPVVVALTNFGSATQTTIPVTVEITGPVSNTLNYTYSGSLAQGQTTNVAVGAANFSAAGTYTIKAYTSLSGDGVNANDTALVTINVVGAVTLPQTCDFTGFTGANLSAVFPTFREGQGIVPNGTTSLWTSQTGVSYSGNVTARINLYTTNRNEWIVSSRFPVSANTYLGFKAAVTDFLSTTAPDVMGSDDKVQVMVSTDCGLTWNSIYTIDSTFNLPITLQQFYIPLGAYAGQEIHVAFYATDGPYDDNEDYDFHLDDINIYNLNGVDIMLQSVNVTNSNNTCKTSNDTIVFTIMNNTPATVDFSIDSVLLTANITGPLNQSYSTMLNAGTLAPMATMNVLVSSNADFTISGNYGVESTAIVQTYDYNTSNDTILSTILSENPVVSIVNGDTIVCEGAVFNLYSQGIFYGVNPADTLVTYNDTTYAIPDNNLLTGISAPVNVVAPYGGVASEILFVRIDSLVHTWNADLDIYLVAPDGSMIELSTDNGGSSDNYIGTTFSMSAGVAINAGTGPFTGTYLPEQSFANLTGVLNGTWILKVFDDVSGDVGTLYKWTLGYPGPNGVQTISWTPALGINNTTIANPVLTATQTNTYTVTYTDQKGCSASDDITVSVNPLPAIDLGNDTTICSNASLLLDAGSGFSAYQWSTGQTSQTITYANTTPGTYTIWVQVTDINACSNTDTILVTIQTCGGINENSLGMIQLYPSPVNDVLYIRISDYYHTQLSMYLSDVSGKILYQQNVNLLEKNACALDVKALPTGMYFLTIYGEGLYRMIKFVKE